MSDSGVLIDPRGCRALLQAYGRDTHESSRRGAIDFLVFDLLWQDGVDLRGLPLSERKRDLDRLCRKSKVPFMRQVQTFPDGPLLFEQLQQVWIRGCRQQALGVALLKRAEPQMGQDEVPGLEARQCRALAHIRGSAQARADGSPEDASKEAGGARSGARASAIARADPWHRA